jgi:hypothetical protein
MSARPRLDLDHRARFPHCHPYPGDFRPQPSRLLEPMSAGLRLRRKIAHRSKNPLPRADMSAVYSITRFAIANRCIARMSGAPFQKPPFKHFVAARRDMRERRAIPAYRRGTRLRRVPQLMRATKFQAPEASAPGHKQRSGPEPSPSVTSAVVAKATVNPGRCYCRRVRAGGTDSPSASGVSRIAATSLCHNHFR